MNANQQQRLNALLADGYDFRFGDYLSKGFELFQKNAGNFIAFGVVAGIITVFALIIPILGWIAAIFFLIPALTAGIYIVAHRLDRGEQVEFRDLFKGFDYAGNLAAATFMVALTIGLSLIPYFFVAGGLETASLLSEIINNPQAIERLEDLPKAPFWAVLLYAPAIYLSVSYSWTLHFIVFYQLGAWEAMEMSRQIIAKAWIQMFLYVIVLNFIASVGILALFVGILVTYPIMLCAQYAAFAEVTGLLEDEDEGGIMEHLVG
jgi:uncharacterized membrane protein